MLAMGSAGVQPVLQIRRALRLPQEAAASPSTWSIADFTLRSSGAFEFLLVVMAASQAPKPQLGSQLGRRRRKTADPALLPASVTGACGKLPPGSQGNKAQGQSVWPRTPLPRSGESHSCIAHRVGRSTGEWPPAEAKGEDVQEYVSRIGEQRQAASPPASCNFYHQDGGSEQDGYSREPTFYYLYLDGSSFLESLRTDICHNY